MSRIIISKYEDGQEHIVVGYDRPMDTYYWQEFAREFDDDGVPIWETDEEWEEVIGFAGYMHRELPEITDLFAHAATHNDGVFNVMMNHEKVLLPELERHKTLDYPQSNVVVDLTDKS